MDEPAVPAPDPVTVVPGRKLRVEAERKVRKQQAAKARKKRKLGRSRRGKHR